MNRHRHPNSKSQTGENEAGELVVAGGGGGGGGGPFLNWSSLQRKWCSEVSAKMLESSMSIPQPLTSVNLAAMYHECEYKAMLCDRIKQNIGKHMAIESHGILQRQADYVTTRMIGNRQQHLYPAEERKEEEEEEEEEEEDDNSYVPNSQAMPSPTKEDDEDDDDKVLKKSSPEKRARVEEGQGGSM